MSGMSSTLEQDFLFFVFFLFCLFGLIVSSLVGTLVFGG